MRADGRLLRLAGLLAAAALAGAGPAGAQVYGTAQFQYQNVEDVRAVILADGTRVLRRSTTEHLLKSIDVRHQSQLRQNLLMDSNLRFVEQTRQGTPERLRTPSGTLRLLHPSFQLTAQHQPTTMRAVGSRLSSAAVADTAAEVTTTRTAETLLLGNAIAPGGVSFNASWQHRRREGEVGVPVERHELRNVRANLDRSRYSLYASMGDQLQKRGESKTPRAKQGQYALGGLWRVAPSARASMTLQYDLARARSQPGGSFVSRTTTQNAQWTGEWRPRGDLSGSAVYNWRRASVNAVNRSSLSDQEGQMLGRWTPRRGASLTTGGGFRTQRDLEGRARLLEYATAIAAADGRVRPGWTANANATHTTSWDPDRGTYGTQTVTGLSRMEFGRRASLDATLSLVANGDTAAVSNRWSNIWTTRLHTQPLRTITLTAGVRSQRIGPGLLRPLAVARGLTFDGAWRPHPRFDGIANYSVNEALTGPRAKTRTWSSTARAQLSDRWQLQGLWSRTATPQLAGGVESIATHDQATGRLLWQPTRWVAAAVSLSSTDPGKELETRRIDGTFTWSFGR